MTKQYECLNPDCPIYKRGENFDHPSCYDCPYKVINLSSVESNNSETSSLNESKRIKSEFATFQNDTLSPLENAEKRKVPKLLLSIAIPLVILIITGVFLLFSKLYSNDNGMNSNNNLALMKDKDTELLATISGSSTIGEKLMPALVKSYITNRGGTNITEFYNTKELDISIFFRLPDKKVIQEIRIVSKGSSTAFTDLEEKVCEIGMASRKIKKEEDEKISSSGLGNLSNTENETIIGLDGVSIIINNGNNINDLSKNDIQDIFSGKITNWSKLGGHSGKIKIYSRGESSGSYDFFMNTIMDKTPLSKNIEVKDCNNDISDAVAANLDGIGYVSMGYIGSAKPIAISDGQSEFLLPTPFSIATEEYILSRRLYLYSSPENSNEFTDGLISFANTDEGQAILTESDYISNNVFPLTVGQIPTLKWTDKKLKKSFDTILSRADSRLSVNIRFQTDKSNLDKKSIDDLNRVVDFLNRSQYLNYKVALIGYTDSVGDKAQNIELSKERAQFVSDQLIELNSGLKKRIEIYGFGSEQPISTNDTDKGKNKNRRVEIWLIRN
ncbi:MAG: phosphate ABC transporter substrate-binding/OmpA family protein [Clostridiales bacterium]